jgi:hypothetical protein
MALNPRRQFHASVSLAPPERDATTLARLTFDLQAVVPKESVTVSLPVPSPGSAAPEAADSPLSARILSRETLDAETRIRFEVVLPEPEGRGPLALRVAPLALVTYRDGDGRPVSPTQEQISTAGTKQTRSVTLPTPHLSEVSVEAMTQFTVETVRVTFEKVTLP